MNTISDIIELSFTVSDKTESFPCVSGRVKYDDKSFSIKCRLEGITDIRQFETAEELSIRFSDKEPLLLKLTNITIESVSTSISKSGTNSLYKISREHRN